MGVVRGCLNHLQTGLVVGITVGVLKRRNAKAPSQPNELEFPGLQPRPLYFKHFNRLRATVLSCKLSTAVPAPGTWLVHGKYTGTD